MRKESKKDTLNQILVTPNELSPEQKAAVIAKERQVKIIAGAGAGKTETLTRRIVYLLLIENVKPSEIVAFTFTEKAAQNLKERIYQRVDLISGHDAAVRLGEMFIGTIHSYAKRILDDHFNTGKNGVLDENQEIAFLMRHGWGLGLDNFGKNYIDGCHNFRRTVNMVWDEMLDMEEVKRRAAQFHEAMTKYTQLLRDHHQFTFGWMMHLAAIKLGEKPEVMSNVKHLIVDEYQDINQSQSILIETIGKTAGLFVVGDPRQSIYQWRGSDERFFSKFADTFKGTREITIKENRRSTDLVVKNANTFAGSFESTKYSPMETVRKVPGYLGLAESHQPSDEAFWLVNQIERLVNKNGLAYSDIGIMMRSISTSGGPLLDEMRRRRIPFIVGGKLGLFRRDEAQAVGRIFAWFSDEGFWVQNPWRWNDQITGDDLLESALTYWFNVGGQRVPSNSRERLEELKKDILYSNRGLPNFTEIYHRVLDALGFHSLDHEDRNDATVMANLGRFNELLTDYEVANRLGGRQISWKRDLKSLCWYMNSYATRAYEEGAPEDTRGVDAVQVMTVHQAKGLEWPVVFVTSMVERRFPSSMIGTARNWCGIPRELFDVARYEGSIEDERRLFYVAITRARDALVVSYFRKKSNYVSMSDFVDALMLDSFASVGGQVNLPKLTVDNQAIEQEMLTFSAGEIITYERCPYMYLLGNVWGFQPGLDQALGYGNSLHHCLRRASELVKKEGINPASAVATAVDEDFFIPYAGGEVFQTFKNSALETLVTFADKYAQDFGNIEEVEYRLEFPIQGATLTGRVDVLLRDHGTLEVRDYKTSEEARSFEETSAQVRLYAIGLNGLGRNVAKGTVAYLEEADVREVSVVLKELRAVRIRAEKTVESIKGCQFEPRAGEWCGSCDRKPICRWGVGR